MSSQYRKVGGGWSRGSLALLRRARVRAASALARDRMRARAQLGETCPLSTEGRTRRVRLVRGEGRDVSS